MIFKSQYVRMLESEIERLRQENAALIDSLLGVAGVAPIMQSSTPQGERRFADVTPARKRSMFQMLRRREAADRKKLREEMKAATPEKIEEMKQLLSAEEQKIAQRNGRFVEAPDA